MGTLATLSLLTVSGTGATGTASAASYATYTQGGSTENYSNGPTDTAAALAGPGEPNHAGLSLLQGWTEILEPGGADGLADPTRWPRALALALPDGLVPPPLAPGVAAKYEGLFPYFTGWRVFAMTDRPWRVPDGPYNPATRETDWLTQASAGAGLPVNQWRVWALLLPGGPAEPVLDDAWLRFEQAARAADPLALTATKSWEALRAALPPGGSVTTDYWRRGVEWAAGVADQLTGGLFRTQFGRWLLNSSGYGLLTGGDLSLGGFINTQSGSYQAGQQAGQVVQIALTVWTPGGWLGVAANALRGYQLAGGLAQAGDAALAGRWTDAGWMAGQSLAMFAIQAGPCVVGAAAKGWTASKAAGEFAGSVAEFAAVWVTRGISVVQGVGSGVQGIQAIANGDLVGGMLQVAQGAADIFSATRSCFTFETELETPAGLKPIIDFHPGDKLWSRNELDADGPVEVKEVEAVFATLGRVWHLHVAGRVIRTTGEHPFRVQGKGWRPVHELQPGDLLSTRTGGQWAVVEEVYDTGEYETVYNLRVADYHTYFVGGNDWGFSVWAHNEYGDARDYMPNKKKWEKKGGLVIENDGAPGYTTYIRKDGVTVTYNSQGHPDFGPHALAKVKIGKQQPDRYKDFIAANKAVGMPEAGAKAPIEGTTWHHHEDGVHMLLVPSSIHNVALGGFPHAGGVSGL